MTEQQDSIEPQQQLKMVEKMNKTMMLWEKLTGRTLVAFNPEGAKLFCLVM